MEHKDIPSVPCWPSVSDSEYNTGNKTAAPAGVKPGPRGPTYHSSKTLRRRTHSIKTQIKGEIHFSRSEACKYHSCATCLEHGEASDAVSSKKSEQVEGPKRSQTLGSKRNKAAIQKSLGLAKKSHTIAEAGKENTLDQPEVQPTQNTQESSPGPVLLCWPTTTLLPLQYSRMAVEHQLVPSPFVEPRGNLAFPSGYPHVILTPCTITETLQVEPQVPAQKQGSGNLEEKEPSGWAGQKASGSEDSPASDQASEPATFVCQEVLEAAEALMALKNSAQAWPQKLG